MTDPNKRLDNFLKYGTKRRWPRAVWASHRKASSEFNTSSPVSLKVAYSVLYNLYAQMSKSREKAQRLCKLHNLSIPELKTDLVLILRKLAAYPGRSIAEKQKLFTGIADVQNSEKTKDIVKAENIQSSLAKQKKLSHHRK